MGVAKVATGATGMTAVATGSKKTKSKTRVRKLTETQILCFSIDENFTY